MNKKICFGERFILILIADLKVWIKEDYLKEEKNISAQIFSTSNDVH